jgi:HEAT repeat protein
MSKRASRYQTGVRTLVALVACCALIFWAWRRVRESSDPTLAEAQFIQARAIRALDSPRSSDQIAAIHELERLHLVDSAVAVRALTALLADSDYAVRLATAEAIGSLGASTAKAGSDVDGIGAAVAALINILKDQAPGIRVAAASSLGAIGSANRRRSDSANEAVIAALTKALEDKEATVRLAAVVALATASSGAARPPKALAGMLTDKSAEIRRRTVELLWREFPRGLDSWIPSLLQMAEHDEDPGVRQWCFGALTWIKPPAITPAVIPLLIAKLESRDQRVRSAIAALLSQFGAESEDAIPALLRNLKERIDEKNAESDEAADWPAASALGRIAPGSASSAEVVAVLTEIVRSGPRIRQGPAAWALGKFGPAAAPAIPGLIRMVRENAQTGQGIAAIALGLIAPETPAADEAVAVLVPLLNSKSSDVRAAALESLSQFGPKSAVALTRIRELRKEDGYIRRLAEKALAAIETETKP